MATVASNIVAFSVIELFLRLFNVTGVFCRAMFHSITFVSKYCGVIVYN